MAGSRQLRVPPGRDSASFHRAGWPDLQRLSLALPPTQGLPMDRAATSFPQQEPPLLLEHPLLAAHSSVFQFIKWVPTTPACFRTLTVTCMPGILRGGQEWEGLCKDR